SITVPDTSTAMMNRLQRGRSTRINALWGLRSVRYLRVSGFDALEGAEDLRTGTEISTLVGKGIKALGGADDDMFVSGDVYLGFGSRSSFAALDFSSEGRKLREGDWDGVLTHGRGAIYLKPFVRHPLIANATWSGG